MGERSREREVGRRERENGERGQGGMREEALVAACWPLKLLRK